MAFDRDGNLLVCVGGMGLYQVAPDRTVTKLTDETNRSLFSVIDDSRLRLADDLDIAPDGRIYFTEATIRYEHARLGDRRAGEPRQRPHHRATTRRRTRRAPILPNLIFPNGVCIAHDGQSFLFAETWACRINRYWFDGPKARAACERVISDLPGYPDNINRASDGNYWLALVGMRTPALDLAMTHARLPPPHGAARRAGRVALSRTSTPAACVKFDETGRDPRDAVGSGRRATTR